MARNLQCCWTVSWRICHHYIFKELSFWKSYQLVSSAIRSDIQYIDSKRRGFIFDLWTVSPRLLRWRKGDLCSVHTFNFFFSQCAFSEMVIQFMVFIVWLTFAIAIEGSLSLHLKRNLQGNSDSRYIFRNCSDQYFHWAGCNKRV